MRREAREQRTDLEVLERVSPLVELKSATPTNAARLLFMLDGRDRVLGRRRLLGGGRGGFGGSGEHLNHLFERGGVSLDKGGRVGVIGVGSGDGWGRLKLGSGAAAAASAAIGTVTVG